MDNVIQQKLDFLKLDSDNPNLLAEVADYYIKQGDIDEASSYVERGLKTSPEHQSLIFVKGTLAIASNNPDEAIKTLEQLKFDIGTAQEVRYNLAYAHLLNSESLLARDELLPIINEPQVIPAVLLLFARVCHHLGEMDDAEKYADEYLKQYPSDAEALGVMALIKLDVEAEDASEWAEKALSLNENNLEGLVTKGNVALTNLDKFDAEPYFERAVAAHGKSGRAHAGLGLVHMSNMKLENARDELEKAVNYMPGHIGTWHALAWCQILEGDLNAGKQSFEKANDVDRNFGETYGGLAVIAAMEGKTDQARELSKKALGLDGQSFSARYAQSLIIANAGGEERATKMIEKILDAEVVEGAGSLKGMLLKLQRNTQQKPDRTNH